MTSDTAWLGSMPETYDRCLGPALFAPFAVHVAALAAAEPAARVLELAAGRWSKPPPSRPRWSTPSARPCPKTRRRSWRGCRTAITTPRRSDLVAGGFHDVTVDQVVLPGPTPSARAVADGFCLGTPLCVAIGDHMATTLGAGPIEGDLAALVVTAR